MRPRASGRRPAGLPVCAFLLMAGASPAMAQEPPVSAEARALYEQTRDSVAQIRVLLGASDSHSATGTGFLVGSDLILTNYHVVADKALDPATYRLEFVLPGGRRGPLQIVAVDVVHDLAVVRGGTGGVPALPLRGDALNKGDKGFSLGYPLGQGLTVVEGIYNGRSEEQYYERIHFTGAINPGMSGGPVVDPRGRAFGINVASRRRGQLVSFLVPAKFAQRLLARAATARPPTDFRDEVGAQLKSHDAEIMGALLKAPLPVQKLGEFDVPAKSGEFMQCSADTERETGRPYTVDSYRCFTFSALYIDERLHTGMVSFRHDILRGGDLGALRFAHLQEMRFGAGRFGFGGSFDRKHHTRYACNDEIVALHGAPAKMVMCVRRYKRFEQLYDIVVRVATLGDTALALHSELQMDGVSYEAAALFSQRYLEGIRWNR